MTTLFLFWIVLTICHVAEKTMGQQCPSERSISGRMLQRHVYKTMLADIGLHCLPSCSTDDRCQSFNFVISSHMCEFNDRTKEAKPEDFIPDPDRYYFRKPLNRLPLGSIPELAAESCKEIKMSEEEATSGKYWLSSIKPGIPLFAFCNMTTEDIDECTASPSACHSDAQCSNTIGSYRCTCNPGHTGNGKTCSDIDECSIANECHQNATCHNTKGSYNCTCNGGFKGDGRLNCTEHTLQDSVIIGDNQTYFEMLSNWLKPVVQVNGQWILCWRASLHGWATATFHSLCNNKGPTVTIVKDTNNSIFGGYTSISWQTSLLWKNDSKAFLFSLKNPTNNPRKLLQIDNKSLYSVDHYVHYGPSFGRSDLLIRLSPNRSRYSSENLGYTYTVPSGKRSDPFLTGNNRFIASEIETFYETTQ
ncbi:uncharacterized protein [Acropora muricata]|uniref:uncharacterized protein isoform X2 n=1 Tax=Acropora muricata TaxID=159855 RepID=UPI0034E4B320